MARDDTPNTASVRRQNDRSVSSNNSVSGRVRRLGAGGVAVDSKSTVHNHLQTLRELGYVVQDGDEYRLGLQFLGLGDRARQRHDLYHVVKPETDSLVEAVGERAQVMVEEGGVGIYVYQSLADQAVRTDSHIGTVVDLHATSVGKAYLAHLSDDRLDALLDRVAFDDQTPQTLTDAEALRTELDEDRRARVRVQRRGANRRDASGRRAYPVGG